MPFGLLGVAGQVDGYQTAVCGDSAGNARSGEGLLQVLQHIHELLRGLGDRKVFVMDHNKLADRKCLGEL